MTSLIGLSAQQLADELRRRGIISIKVDEWTESEDGEITLSPTLSVGVSADKGCYLMQRTVPYVKLGYRVIAGGIFTVEALEQAIIKARWKGAKIRKAI